MLDWGEDTVCLLCRSKMILGQTIYGLLARHAIVNTEKYTVSISVVRRPHRQCDHSESEKKEDMDW